MVVLIGTNLTDTLTGTDESDRLVGGDGADFLLGQGGADLLFGGTGDDFLYGGAGDDQVFTGAGEDAFFGGSGIDTVLYADAAGPVRLDLLVAARNGGAALGDSFAFIERFRLTQIADDFTGSAFGEVVFGGDGADTLRGGGGNDRLFARFDSLSVLDGGDGRDSLDGGNRLFGGSGNDTLRGGFVSATLQGGEGDDDIFGSALDDVLMGGAGRDQLFGGLGSDTLSYRNDGAVTLDLVIPAQSSGAAAGDRLHSIEVIALSRESDVLNLGNFTALIFGGGGNDRVTGGAVADFITGDAGRDTLVGAAGADLLFGGSGLDSLIGGDGDDRIYGGVEAVAPVTGGGVGSAFGGAGNDRVYGGNIRDLLWGGVGDDGVYGGLGADTLLGDAGRDSLLGGAGDDLLNGGSGGDTIDGGAGRDTLRYTGTVSFDAGNPALHTGDAAGDVLLGVERLAFLGVDSRYVGGAGAMTIFASATGLRVMAGMGAETVFDATGTMVVSFEGAVQGVTLASELTALVGSRGAAGDTFVGAGTFRLTSFRDVVHLNADANPASFFLGAGNDSIVLTQPSGLFFKFPGPSPVFDGGDGNDVLETSISLAKGNMFGGAGNDTLSSTGTFGMSGGAGDDVITGLISAEGSGGQITGDEGNDTITVTGRSFRATGGTGNDTISATYLVSGQRAEILKGGAGDDTITITVRQSFEQEFPGTASLSVNGGAGDDMIRAGGSQGFFAAAHVDFIFNADWGNDTILQFADEPELEGGDVILFENTASIGLDSFADLTVTQGEGFTVVAFGTNSIRLDGIMAASFTAEDVLFT